jgi:hypothetical protein
VAGAVDWDIQKVQDEAYQREYKRQQTEQQQQASAQSSRGPVCGVAIEMVAILFAAFAGFLAFFSACAWLSVSVTVTERPPGLAHVTSSDVVRFSASFVLLAVVNPLLWVLHVCLWGLHVCSRQLSSLHWSLRFSKIIQSWYDWFCFWWWPQVSAALLHSRESHLSDGYQSSWVWLWLLVLFSFETNHWMRENKSNLASMFTVVLDKNNCMKAGTKCNL